MGSWSSIWAVGTFYPSLIPRPLTHARVVSGHETTVILENDSPDNFSLALELKEQLLLPEHETRKLSLPWKQMLVVDIDGGMYQSWVLNECISDSCKFPCRGGCLVFWARGAHLCSLDSLHTYICIVVHLCRASHPLYLVIIPCGMIQCINVDHFYVHVMLYQQTVSHIELLAFKHVIYATAQPCLPVCIYMVKLLADVTVSETTELQQLLPTQCNYTSWALPA